MIKGIFLKFLLVIPTLIGASLIAFFLVRLVPGDPVTNLLGERGADPKVVAEMRAQFGLDLPMHEQYFIFMKKVIIH